MEAPHDGLLYNVEKAGLNKNTAHQISKTIVETSKDTKFYERQVKKSQNLDKLVESMKFKITCTTKAEKLEAENQSSQLISILSRKRDLTSTFLHADLDMFYAAVEALYDPSLKDIPFAVGGDIKHGVISTSSYKARQFGVRSGMAVFIAFKLCPDLKLVPHHGERYVHYSNIVRSVFRKYDPNFISGGLDEASLNITTLLQKDSSLTPESIAENIQKEVFELTKLTLSIGIAHTTQLAKIASDYNKPNGIFRMPEDPDELVAFIGKLPIRKIPGIGGVSEQTLKGLGINTVGDILEKRVDIWLTQRPLFREFLFSAALGVYQRSLERPPVQSISKETTIDATNDKCKIMDVIEKLATQVATTMRSSGCSCRTVTVKFKDSNFNLSTRCYTFEYYTSKTNDIINAAFKILFDEMNTKFVKYRLLGVRVSALVRSGEKRQTCIHSYLTKSAPSSPIVEPLPQTEETPVYQYLSSDSDTDIVSENENFDEIQENEQSPVKNEDEEKTIDEKNKNQKKCGPLDKFLVNISEIPYQKSSKPQKEKPKEKSRLLISDYFKKTDSIPQNEEENMF